VKGGQYQFYVGSGLALFSAVLAFLLPDISQDVVAEEDIRFRAFLAERGYDTGLMGHRVDDASSGDNVMTDSHDEKKLAAESARGL
jgi:hypothetical protein